MLYLSNFARPLGAKDKKKREPRKPLTENQQLIRGGAIGGAALGLDSLGSNYVLKKQHGFANDTLGDSLYKKELAKIGMTKRGVILQNLGLKVPLGVALGVGGTKLGLMLKNKLRKNKDKK